MILHVINGPRRTARICSGTRRALYENLTSEARGPILRLRYCDGWVCKPVVNLCHKKILRRLENHGKGKGKF